jgi:small subunit ribosomal protein S16
VATRIRLSRAGRRHLPFYHIGVYDIRQRRDAEYVEKLGHYDPTNKNEEETLRLDTERAAYWLGVGATPSETVRALLKMSGVEVPEKPKATARPRKERSKDRKVKTRTKARTANSKTRAAKKANA